MTLDGLPGWALDLLETARVAHLAFLDEATRPRVLPVTFAVAGGSIWSVVDEKPKRAAGAELARVRLLRRNPAAALTVDRYEEDWSRLAWVQLLGRVDVLGLDEGGDGLEALARKYAPYRDRRPPGPLLRLSIERGLHWRAA